MSYAEEQHGRDLRERLNSRRQQQKSRHPSLRSRSRSSENADSEVRGPGSSRYGRPGRRVRRDSRSSWPSESTDSRTPPPSRRSSCAPFKRETDPAVLARRQKQLDYGKNTLCYQEYTKTVPKDKRESFHPRTPIKQRQTSRRRWDSAIKNWRIHLHYWNDPVKLAELRKPKDSDSDASESESDRTVSVVSTPDRRRANASRPARRPDAASGVKQEPDISAVKQEPLDEQVRAARRTPRQTGVAAVKQETADYIPLKQEPVDPELAEVAPERLDPEPVAVKQEPLEQEQEPEPSQREMTGEVKWELGEPEAEFSWADDVEGLADEFADGPIV